MVMTSNERQKRYIERLKAASVTNGVADTDTNRRHVSDEANSALASVSDVTAWWEQATKDQRAQLCEAIGGRELAATMDGSNDEFETYVDEVIESCLEDYAESWGYKKIEAGA